MIELENDGVCWQLQPDFAPLLEEVLKAPGQPIKVSAVKRVTLHRVGERTFYVKRYIHGAIPFRSLKFFFKRSQASQEWQLAQQIEARGVPIVRHLALGELWGWRGLQVSFLITEGFPGAPLDPAQGVDPAFVLAFVVQMHDRGVIQDDLHPGNLLVRSDPLELRLVDLHGTRIVSHVDAADRRQNLALLRVFLPVPVAPEIERLSRLLRQTLLERRSKRCLRDNRDFESRRLGGLKWQVRLPLLTDAVCRVLRDPDGFLRSGAQILKPGRTATVGKADGLVLKRFNFRKIENLAKDLFRPSRARRAFQGAYHLELANIPTARPIATASHRFLGFLVRSYLLMEEIDGALDLGAYLRGGQTPKLTLVRETAKLIGALHDAGFSHRDLKESNLVVDSRGRIYLLDLDGLRFMRGLSQARVALDLARLGRGVARYPVITARHRLVFLLNYSRARRLKIVPRET